MSERCEDSVEEVERLLRRLSNLESGSGEKQVNEIVTLAKALAHPQRLKFLSVIGSKEVCVCKLVGVSELSQPAISHHLNILARAGLLRRRRKGRFNHYQANPRLIKQMVNQVQELISE